MKNKFIKSSIILSFFALQSCGDENNFEPYKELTENRTEARVKFFNEALDTGAATFRINIYDNNNSLITPTVPQINPDPAITTPIPNPGLNYTAAYPLTGGNYSLVSASTTSLRVQTGYPDITPRILLQDNITLENNKNYSYYFVGISTNYSLYKLNDVFPASIPAKKSYIRFVNVVSNSPDVGYDLKITRRRVNEIGQFLNINNQVSTSANAAIDPVYEIKGIKFKDPRSEAFVEIDAQTDLATEPYIVELRDPGSNDILFSATAANGNAFTPRQNRIYTIVSRGNHGPTGTARRSSLVIHTNK